MKYLKTDDYKKFVATTTIDARDVEVTYWGADITVFLRLSNGRALYFTWNYEVSNDGQLGIGIVTDLSEGREFRQNGSYYSLWKAKLSDVAASYNSSDTNNDHFTFGASGFDIYLKYNDIDRAAKRVPSHGRWPSFPSG